MSHPRLGQGSSRCRALGWGLAVLGVWVVEMGAASAAPPPPSSTTLGGSVRSAIADHRVQKSPSRGFDLNKEPFDDVPAEGGVLIGFEVGLGRFMNLEVVYALRPLYLTDRGMLRARPHGLFTDKITPDNRVIRSKVQRTVRLLAPQGYAVGDVTLRTGLLINGLSLRYLKIDGQGLDLTHSGVSPWVGDRTGGSESTLSGQGEPIVGIFGTQDQEKVSSLGLTFLSPRLDVLAPAVEVLPQRKAAAVGTPALNVANPTLEAVAPTPKNERASADEIAASTANLPATVPAKPATEPANDTNAARVNKTKEAAALLFLAFGAVGVTSFLVLFMVALRKKRNEPDSNAARTRSVPHARPAQGAVPADRVPVAVGVEGGAEAEGEELVSIEVWEADNDPLPPPRGGDVTLEMVQKWAMEGEPPRRSGARTGGMQRAFGVLGGVVAVTVFQTVIAPTYFPMIEGQGFNQLRMLFAGVAGGIGGALGAAFGMILDGGRR